MTRKHNGKKPDLDFRPASVSIHEGYQPVPHIVVLGDSKRGYNPLSGPHASQIKPPIGGSAVKPPRRD